MVSIFYPIEFAGDQYFAILYSMLSKMIFAKPKSYKSMDTNISAHYNFSMDKKYGNILCKIFLKNIFPGEALRSVKKPVPKVLKLS